MRNSKYIIYLVVVVLFGSGVLINGCRKDTEFVPSPPPPPTVPQNTQDLEAKYVTSAPGNINSGYWAKANYHKVTVADMSTGLYYTSGSMVAGRDTEPNMTGTILGKMSFNAGTDPEMILKAAYDDNNLYILAQWTDKRLDLSQKNWIWKGPVAVDRPSSDDTAYGWISQRNSDRLAFAFQIDSAYSLSNNATSFTQSGCATACHKSSSNPGMYPDAGKVDIWEWSMACSAPMGYANDMVTTAGGLVNDDGKPTYFRNGTSDTSGPEYEWNGVSQQITLPNGQTKLLNPAYYLYAPDTMPFTGNMKTGDSIFHSSLPGGYGECYSCHGEYGESGQYMQINNDINLYTNSRATMISTLGNITEMTPYWPTGYTQQNNLIAYLKGIIGSIPGYILQQPDGSAADITAYDNVTAGEITSSFTKSTSVTYKVLFIRKLNTGNTDDMQFNLLTRKVYKFGIALMDNDGKNHIGSQVETLIFK